MSRRPPHDYYEEDDFEIERERDRYPRSRQRDREFEEEDVQYRRRRSMPPVEDLERMHIRDRPPRDFMRESFAPPTDRAPVSMRRPRDEIDGVIPERERDEVYMRPSRERRRPRREIEEEKLIINEREGHGGRPRRRSERDIEEDLVVRRRGRPSRDYESEGDFKPRERFEEQDETFVRRSGPRRKPRPRSREEELEELLVDESEMDRPRRKLSREEPILEREEIDEVMIDDRERPRERRPRRESNYDRHRESDDIIDDREQERLRERKPRKARVKEELVMQWKDRPSPGELDEEEVRIRETRRPKRRSPPVPVFAPEPPGALPLRGDRVETEEEIRIRSRVRPRPHHRDVEEEEEIVIRRDERERDRRRRTEDDEEILLRREDRSRGHRLNAEEDEELLIRREERDRDRHRVTKNEEELIIRRDERDRHGEETEDEVILRKGKRRSPPRKPSPDVASIHAPPIHQDVITHHRHIDHGFEASPRAPSPDASSQTSIDEVDYHHRSKKGGHKSEEDLVYEHRSEKESVSPTSRPSLDFNNPWEADGVSTSRRRPKSIVDDTESIKQSLAGSIHSRAKRSLARELELDEETEEEEIEVHEERSGPRSSTRSLGKGIPDVVSEWSMVHAPKTEALEMSSALNVIEVAPKGAIDDEIDRKVVAQVSKEPLDERWTEITKDLVVREAIERLGYEFEETRTFYYVFSYLKPGDIDEIVELSDEIRSARRRRIREMHRERTVPPPRPPRPRSLVDRMPPRARMAAERRIREREWIIDARR
ncbi:uncharacterized protein N7443_003790 [Penicillium atrosanguineum]|uniref:uncharacterized protein n=1 Tax=Penicillium atrosanguineum TaxID=1132637 RepID=UPI00238C5392|nr:uncharacterized protein N7443_003790 [Penicillium atrosanguineum]KAJ5304130.1 hypothetical protein N7443_003790 [Penicillium atrosanguineum]